jgi:hypothetical protein
MSKRRQDDRCTSMVGLVDRARQRGIAISKELIAQIDDGFGNCGDGEDSFDALVGALSMIEVIDGRRMEQPADRSNAEVWEGWILGQTV